jgi:hypothetical protein
MKDEKEDSITKVRTRNRVTAAQFEDALLEEVTHAQGMNIPRNVISNCTSFCVLLEAKLFGKRDPVRSASFNAMLQHVVEDARVERAEQETKWREQRKAEESRIVRPPGYGKG